MNRFDESFNTIGPATGRPFSHGHPDGVSIITTVYTLILLGTLLQLVIAVVMGPFGIQAVVPLIATTAMFGPPIPLLFRRIKMAAVWLSVLAVLYLIGAIAGAMKMSREGEPNIGALLGMGLLVAGQAYAAFYSYHLTKDSLLE